MDVVFQSELETMLLLSDYAFKYNKMLDVI